MMIGVTFAETVEPPPWELVRHSPHPALRGLLSEYQGYRESFPHGVRRREPATSVIPLILNFGPPFRIGGDYAWGERSFSSFVAGPAAGYAVVESLGAAYCMQVNLAPLGAYRLLGMPMHAIAGQVVDFEDLYGPPALRLLERLRNAPDWASRFDLLDGFFLSRFGSSRPVSPEVDAAWTRLAACQGRIRIEDLARDAGWSRKHLARRFRVEIGESPKTMARILRFERAQRLAQSAQLGWADIALDCGFADQAHLIREFRELAGLTPAELLRRTDPGGGGVLE